MMKDRLRRWRSAVAARLVDDWRCAWRWWSVRLAAFSSALIGYLLAAPDALLHAVNALPADMRAALPAAVPVVTFGLVLALRLYKQGRADG